MLQVIRRPFTGSLLITRFIFGLAFAIFQTIFSLYALTRFNLSAIQTGYILTYVGVLSVFTQGFLVGRLIKRVSEDILITTSVIAMAFCLLGWALSPTVGILLVVLAPTSLAGGLLNTLLTSTLTKSVDSSQTGGILGLSATIDSMTRVFAPALGGVLLASLGTWAPGLFGAILTGGLSFFLWSKILNSPTPGIKKQPALAPLPVNADE
jgi:DHA1 family tetracycline resistance protein-like MFS transporter